MSFCRRRPAPAVAPPLLRVAAVLAGALALLLTGCSGSPSAPAPGLGSPSAAVAPGSTGARAPVPPGFAPASVSFPDAQDAFALGLAPCGGTHTGLCTAFAASADGGLHWAARTSPTLVPSDLFARAILRFADPQNGFVALGGLQATHDGARSWQPVSLPGLTDPRVVAMEESAGFLYVVAGQRGDAGPLRLFESAAQVDAFIAVPGVSLPAAGTSVAFSAAAGTIYLLANTLHGAPRLLLSGDAVHWTTRAAPCPAASTGAVAAADAQDMTVVCDGAPTATGAPKSVYRSSDAGMTFTRAGGPAPAGFTAAAASPGPQVLVVAASAQVDRLYRSADAGRSFDVVYASGVDGSGGGLGFTDLAFTDATHGSVVLGDAGIYARDHAAGQVGLAAPRLLTTTDGGQHWAQTVIKS
ncbi:MAG TPA: hypothetical protein VGN54_10945 [Mycobacteriales bacterium]|nr:hypothetical protein [Mycobacteriales bacterium]